MIIPIYVGLERLPNSLLEASTDLGAKAGRTFRKVVLPQLWPSIIAGSIFTFALTLGDFYMNQIVGGTTQFLGNVVYREFSANLPFAAAYSTLPIVIMIGYLLVVRARGRARGVVAVYLSRARSVRTRRIHRARVRRHVLPDPVHRAA